MSAPDKILLGVNIDHAATLRQARYREVERTCGQFVEPDPLAVALLAEHAGADGITIHLREDRRHIQERDVWRVRESIRTRMNLETACEPACIELALKVKPDSVCLVPEKRQEVSTEGGLDITGQREKIAAIVARMTAAGIKTSLFIDPEPAQIEAAVATGAPWIELHTGAFANAFYEPAKHAAELLRLRRAAEHASQRGLIVNAGHGINYINIADIITIPHLHELNIGHSILSRAILTGIAEAVATMKQKINAR